MDVYDLKSFYNGKMGRVVRRIMQERIGRFWPDMRGLRLAGCGYAVPYLRAYRGEAERVVAMMQPETGALHWPHDEKNCVALSGSNALPLETNSVDRVLLMHGLEHSRHMDLDFDELWRILKSNGRMLVIVPNRSGMWAHADWSPFGQGTPYSWSQLCRRLQEHMFIYERSEEALFLPPIKYSPLLKSAGLLEYIGSHYLPIAAGVHMVEVSKQLYAKPDPGPGSKILSRMPKGFIPKPASTRQCD